MSADMEKTLKKNMVRVALLPRISFLCPRSSMLALKGATQDSASRKLQNRNASIAILHRCVLRPLARIEGKHGNKTPN